MSYLLYIYVNKNIYNGGLRLAVSRSKRFQKIQHRVYNNRIDASIELNNAILIK